jgi:hypothetical protein
MDAVAIAALNEYEWDARSSTDGARVFYAQRLLRMREPLDQQAGTELLA